MQNFNRSRGHKTQPAQTTVEFGTVPTFTAIASMGIRACQKKSKIPEQGNETPAA